MHTTELSQCPLLGEVALKSRAPKQFDLKGKVQATMNQPNRSDTSKQ